MDDLQSNTKLSIVKKVTPPPVESTINQRPRRKIKHKFIKCNRNSPEKSLVAESLLEIEVNVENAHTTGPDTPEASTSQPKTKNQQKNVSKKNSRLSGRQNQCKDNVPDIDDSVLQMVEIIDDPSDDPNVSIEEIIETCVLDAEEYERMITCSKDVCNDSSSNTTTSLTDHSEESFNSSKNKTLCIQNSCDRQISVGLVDCMKNKNILKHLNFDERYANDNSSNSSSTFEEVFDKPLDEVNEKVDIKPTTEFSNPIRTRRVTRLSSISVGRRDMSSPMQLSPIIKIGEVDPPESTNAPEMPTQAKIKISENALDDAVTQIESCSSECERKVETAVSVADTQTIEEENVESSNDNTINDEILSFAEVHKDLMEISAELEVEHLKSIEPPAEIMIESSKGDTETDDQGLVAVLKVESGIVSGGTVETFIPQESTCNDQLTNDEKTKEKTKLKKDRKRTSDKHTVQHLHQSVAEETPQTTSVTENESTEQNKSEFIDYMEKKFQDSEPSPQMESVVVGESEGSVRKSDSSADVAKIEKNKKKRDGHSDKDNKTKPSKKTEKSFDAPSAVKSSSSKLSSSFDKRSKESKDSKSGGESKKSHKRSSSGGRTEKDIIMDQLRLLEQKAANRLKTASHVQANKESSEKPRDSSVKSKIKSAPPDATKVKQKPKEMSVNEQKDDKSTLSKNLPDQGSLNRKQPVTSANRLGGISSRCGTDFILSECYLPKQVKYDETLYSIEALKAAQAAQEEQIKADAEAAKKAREILIAKEEQAKVARAAARLAKQEEAKAQEKAKIEAEKAAKLEAEKAEKAIKATKAAAKAARSKQARDSSNKSTNDSPRIESFGLFAAKDDSQESQTSDPREPSNQDFIPENFKNSPTFVPYQSLDQPQTNDIQNAIKAEETTILPAVAAADEEETNIRRSGRIKTITETKQRACGFGLVKDRDKFHNMYVGDLSYSSITDSQYMSDYNSSNSNSLLDLSEIEKDFEMEPIVPKKEKTVEELEAEKADTAAGLSLFKQIIDCEYRSERTISKETKKMTCDCFLTKSEIERGELGCGEDCLNRLIFIECGSRCAVSDRCTNKRFQKHQNSDCTIFKAGKKGYGMKAVSVIEAGEFIMEYVGEVLNSKQFDDRRFKYSNDNIQHHYFMALRSDCVIDATIKGNISRFINHSCDPNAETQKWTVNGELRIGFFSTRTIQPDEEITFDYQFQRYGKEAQKCYCEAANCRGWIGEEPDSEEDEEEEEEEEEDDDDEEDESEEEIEDEENQIYDKLALATTDLTGQETADDKNLIEPICQEDTNNELQVSEKPVVVKTPSPTKKVRKPKLQPKPKKFKIKKSEIMVDPDLDHEIANLMKTNLKNQEQTLRFSRLMMRAKMLDARIKLLSILRNGEIACRRLFLDYHGLKILHTWMCDPVTNNVQQEWEFRLDILVTLGFLNIPNKNMLLDSKVLSVVLKWANTTSVKENVKSPEESPSDSGSGTPMSEVSSPKVEDTKIVDSLKIETTVELSKVCDDVIDSLKEADDLCKDAAEATDSSKELPDFPKEVVDSDSPKAEDSLAKLKKELVDSSNEINKSSKIVDSLKEIAKTSDDTSNSVVEQLKTGEECADEELMEQIRLMTAKLLESWEHLKKVFRIPKKLRIEQMKEHEQEANRTTDSEDSSKRYGDSQKDKDRYKKEKRVRPIDVTDPETMLLKVQRRRLFEAKNAQHSIDKRNYERQIEAIHVAKCKYFQLDPRTTSYRDIPFSVSPLTGQWYSRDGDMIVTPPSHAHIKPPQELPTNADEYDLPSMDLPPQWKFAIDVKGRLYYYHVKIRIPQWEPPIKILPLREELTHSDDIKTELCDVNDADGKDDSLSFANISNEMDSGKEDDSEESSDAIDSSEDELMQKRQQLLNSFQSNQSDLDISANLAVEISAMATTSDKGSMDDSADLSFSLDNSLLHSIGKKKNRDGLATERLISPRTDEERLQSKIEMQRYKANKEKMRRRRENAKLRPHSSSSEPSRKLKKLTEGLPVVSQQDVDIEETDDEDEVNVSDLEVSVLNAKFVDESDKIANRPDHQKVRLEAIRSNRKVTKRKRNEPEPISHIEAAKRIKEKFCLEMSGTIVQHLGPYRKDDCKTGRITNNDDFKHLARKLTHFVMLKELKHCDNTVTVLEVTDSVRAKSKEFIRKYMAKFGDVYVKPDNEPEYKEFCNT